MRSFFLSVLIISLQTVYGQIPKVVVHDSSLVRLVDVFMDTVRIEQLNKAVIVMELTNMQIIPDAELVQNAEIGPVKKVFERVSYEVRISVQMNISHFKYHVPDFYFEHRGRLVFASMGMNRLVRPSDKSIKNLLRLVRGKLPSSGTYRSPTWWAKVVDGKVFFEQEGYL